MIPVYSMYGIFTYICHKFTINVGMYSIHAASGIYSFWMFCFFWVIRILFHRIEKNSNSLTVRFYWLATFPESVFLCTFHGKKLWWKKIPPFAIGNPLLGFQKGFPFRTPEPTSFSIGCKWSFSNHFPWFSLCKDLVKLVKLIANHLLQRIAIRFQLHFLPLLVRVLVG